MKKEYDVVMLGSLIKRTDEEDSILNKAIEEGVNWIEVGGILLNHRLSGYFYNNFWVNVFPLSLVGSEMCIRDRFQKK